MTWKITSLCKKLPHLNKPILIAGLPGIGNVGKVATDFLIDELKAEKMYEIFSYSFPHSVFVNEKNLIELPTVRLYYKRVKGNDLIFLAGDVQPMDEVASYEFADKMLDIFQEHGGKEIITLGGIGLSEIPKKPKVYCTGNCNEIVARYVQGTDLDKNLYGVVGPIVGISGLLLGLAEKRKIKAVSLLAETFGHPLYLGIRGSKEIVTILNKKLGINADTTKLDKEMKKIESEQAGKGIDSKGRHAGLKQFSVKMPQDVNYIG